MSTLGLTSGHSECPRSPLLEEFGVSQDPPVGVVVDAPVPAKDLEDLDR